MFFNSFPKTFYSFDFKNESPQIVTNVFARFKINSSVLNNSLAFYKYQLVDGDTPEIVSYKRYGDPQYHWIVCMVNDVIDAQFDFPLPTGALERKIIDQYGYTSISEAYAAVHHYELEIVNSLVEVNGPTTVTTENHIVTLDQYNYVSDALVNQTLNNPTTITTNFRANNADPNTAITATLTKVSTYKAVYVYDYEFEANEQKRQIKLLKQNYIPSLVSELSAVLNG